MELSIYGLENNIVFDETHVNILEVKSKKFFSKLLLIINNKYNGIKDGNEIVLKENNIEIDISKNVFIIFDIFNIEYNSKKILNKLYTIIAQNVKCSQSFELEEIILKFRNFLIKEINELPFEFCMKSDINIEDVLKLFSLKIDESCYLSVIEKIEFLIDMIKNLEIAKILIIPNLKIYLTGEELVEIYKYAKYNEVHLLIIENNINKDLLEYEKKNIIDEEFDDFVQIL